MTVRQSLFIAPCSHVFHYKCVRPLLQQYHPGFSCPICRTFANLEEDVEVELEEGVEVGGSVDDGDGDGARVGLGVGFGTATFAKKFVIAPGRGSSFLRSFLHVALQSLLPTC